MNQSTEQLQVLKEPIQQKAMELLSHLRSGKDMTPSIHDEFQKLLELVVPHIKQTHKP